MQLRLLSKKLMGTEKTKDLVNTEINGFAYLYSDEDDLINYPPNTNNSVNSSNNNTCNNSNMFPCDSVSNTCSSSMEFGAINNCKGKDVKNNNNHLAITVTSHIGAIKYMTKENKVACLIDKDDHKTDGVLDEENENNQLNNILDKKQDIDRQSQTSNHSAFPENSTKSSDAGATKPLVDYSKLLLTEDLKKVGSAECSLNQSRERVINNDNNCKDGKREKVVIKLKSEKSNKICTLNALRSVKTDVFIDGNTPCIDQTSSETLLALTSNKRRNNTSLTINQEKCDSKTLSEKDKAEIKKSCRRYNSSYIHTFKRKYDSNDRESHKHAYRKGRHISRRRRSSNDRSWSRDRSSSTDNSDRNKNPNRSSRVKKRGKSSSIDRGRSGDRSPPRTRHRNRTRSRSRNRNHKERRGRSRDKNHSRRNSKNRDIFYSRYKDEVPLSHCEKNKGEEGSNKTERHKNQRHDKCDQECEESEAIKDHKMIIKETTTKIKDLSYEDYCKKIAAVFDSQHAGYGFVQLDDPETARNAMLRLNGKVMPSTNPPIRFKLNPPTTDKSNVFGNEHSIFVGDLSADVDDLKLYQTFNARYPSCVGAKVVLNQDGSTRGYGFVRFTDKTEQTNAMRDMNNFVGLGKCPIRVSTAVQRFTKDATQPQQPNPYEANSYYTGFNAATNYSNTQNYNQQGWYDTSGMSQQTWSNNDYSNTGYTQQDQENSYEQTSADTEAIIPVEDPLEEPELEVDVDKTNKEYIAKSGEFYTALEESRWLCLNTPITNTVAL